MVADGFPVLLGLPLHMVEGQVDGVLHRLARLLLALHIVFLADDDDLADVAVLFHLQHHPGVDHVVEELVDDLGQLRVDEIADIGSDFEITANDAIRHTHCLSSLPF